MWLVTGGEVRMSAVVTTAARAQSMSDGFP